MGFCSSSKSKKTSSEEDISRAIEENEECFSDDGVCNNACASCSTS